MKLIALILSLPTENATVRMRAWRSLKASGAAVLRDGVYLMPDQESCRNTLNIIAADVQSSGGTAYMLHADESDDTDLIQLFDRSGDYTKLLIEIVDVRNNLDADTAAEKLKQARKLRKAFTNLTIIDFFSNNHQQQVDTALQELELAIAQALTPDEPHAIDNNTITRLNIDDFQGQIWATRCRPWVDRLASAWLIRKFIDAQAKFLWLESPLDCPSDALGFDFDGARFTHVGQYVTFEVLLHSFRLEQTGLKRLGALVHGLDVGGIQLPEAAGVESVLAGLRNTIINDDQLLKAASIVFNGLLKTFAQGTTEP
jgi:hypothetical protein